MLAAPVTVVFSMRDAALSGPGLFLTAPLFLTGVALAALLPVAMLMALWRLWKHQA
jgi:hypothetical protein